MALVKYNNNSLSSVTSAAGFPAGAMTLIKTITASSDSTISFVDGSSDVVLDSTYPIYVFKFINIHPASDDVRFTFQSSINGGSSYGVATTQTSFFAFHLENGSDQSLGYSTTFDGSSNTTSFLTIADTIGNDNDQSGSGFLHLFDPSNTTFVKHFVNTFNEYMADDRSNQRRQAGYINTTSAVNAIQFKMSSGNIDAGTIKLYGIKDS
jgi:hypothetical protein